MINKPRLSTLITSGAIAVFLVLLAVFNLTLNAKTPEDYPEGITYEKAVVVEVLTDTIQEDPYYPDIRIGRQDLVLEITSGAHRGERVHTYNLVERIINNPAQVGTKYIVSSFDDFFTVSIVDYNRESTIWLLGLLFVAAVLVWGGRKGAASLFSLAFTMTCIIFLFIPLIIRGADPIPAALLVAALSTVVSLWSLNGWCAKTVAAMASCTGCTLIAGLISLAAGQLAHIDTMNTTEAEDLLFVAQGTNLSLRHLLFAGILFAALGAIMDTVMSITSSIFEMREIDPGLNRARLMRSGMNIGKDIMGTMTNTLILAFTGSSVNTFVIYYLYAFPAIRLVNMPFFVIEIIQGLSASIALVISVPVAAVVASAVCTSPRWNPAKEAASTAGTQKKSKAGGRRLAPAATR